MRPNHYFLTQNWSDWLTVAEPGSKALPPAFQNRADEFPPLRWWCPKRYVRSEFGALLAKHLYDRGLTQSQVCKQMDPPYNDDRMFGRLLNHKANASYKHLDRLAAILNLTQKEYDELDAADNNDRKLRPGFGSKRTTRTPTHFGAMLEWFCFDRGFLKIDLAELTGMNKQNMVDIQHARGPSVTRRIPQFAAALELSAAEKAALLYAHQLDMMEKMNGHC